MPIVRIGTGLIYYAHVPKCGGTSVEDYLRARFGRLALLDKTYMKQSMAARWSVTSAQHIDWASLSRMIPPDFFAASFGVVRHPVARMISSYHFQVQVEKAVSPEVPFSDWLSEQARIVHENPFFADNHLRPQADFIPQDGTVFHLEHGLDAIIPYLDTLAGDQLGPRAVRHDNKQAGPKQAPVSPGAADIALIERVYAADFARFGYRTDQKMPLTAAPDLDPGLLTEAKAARARAARRLPRILTRIKRRLRRWLD